ncbi:MAG: hypothetical protein Q8P46_16335 [Hyphomicrobiales bacterium]|nr:hypothetical protein [Hyphomicrobiales bacterium]
MTDPIADAFDKAARLDRRVNRAREAAEDLQPPVSPDVGNRHGDDPRHQDGVNNDG